MYKIKKINNLKQYLGKSIQPKLLSDITSCLCILPRPLSTYREIYSQPGVSVGSISTDTTNHRLKIVRKNCTTIANNPFLVFL